MLEASRKVVAFTQGESRASLDTDEKLQLALIRLIEIAGEASSRLSPPFRDAHPEVPWGAIAGMRNRLVHAYFAIDLDRVWDTATMAMPVLVSQLEAMLAPDSAGEAHDPPAVAP